MSRGEVRSARFTAAEVALLGDAAERAGVSVSEFLRAAALAKAGREVGSHPVVASAATTTVAADHNVIYTTGGEFAA